LAISKMRFLFVPFLFGHIWSIFNVDLQVTHNVVLSQNWEWLALQKGQKLQYPLTISSLYPIVCIILLIISMLVESMLYL
jgi:hypothetical protein